MPFILISFAFDQFILISSVTASYPYILTSSLHNLKSCYIAYKSQVCHRYKERKAKYPKKRGTKKTIRLVRVLGIHISPMSSQVAPNHRCKCAIYYSSKAKVKNENKT